MATTTTLPLGLLLLLASRAPAALAVAPSCAHAHDGSCPPPPWPAQWRMNLSTVIQPCNASGYFKFGSRYGLASFDWSNAKALWSANPNDQTNCSEVLVEQARVVKAGNTETRVFVYRNMLLALEWIRGQRVAMDDPKRSDYFLKYQSGPKKGQIYNEPQFNGLRQYFWDYTNPAVVDHWIAEVTGPDAAGSPYVDGIFTDGTCVRGGTGGGGGGVEGVQVRPAEVLLGLPGTTERPAAPHLINALLTNPPLRGPTTPPR